MPGVFEVKNVLEWVVDGFNDTAFAQHQFVKGFDRLSFHVLFQGGNQLDTLGGELLRQGLGKIATVSEELAQQGLDQFGDGFAVIDITRRDTKRNDTALVVDDQMQLEAACALWV